MALQYTPTSSAFLTGLCVEHVFKIQDSIFRTLIVDRAEESLLQRPSPEKVKMELENFMPQLSSEESLELLFNRMRESNNSNFPPPAPPSSRKDEVFKAENFSDIDWHAANAPADLLNGGADKLLDYLRQGGLCSELHLLRAIYTWLGTQELVKNIYTRDDVAVDSMYSFLRLITTDNDFLCLLFNYICMEAGLPCKNLFGCTKLSNDFRVYDLDVRVNYLSNAVYVDGSWRFVAVNAAFLGVSSPAVPAGCVLIEDSGMAKRERPVEEKTPEFRQVATDDFYFLTDPDIWIRVFLPCESAWQLLKEPWSTDKFLHEPAFHFNYFTTPWRLSDQKEHKITSRMTAVNGKCSVTFVKPEGSTTLKYRLYFIEERSKNKLPEALQLTDYILINNNCTDKTQALTTRLPVNGLYLLEIMDEKGAPLCEISILMKQKKGVEKKSNKSKNVGEQQKLPPGSKIYGPDQAAVDMGLVDISREEGVLVAREGEKIRMTFRTRRPLEVKVSLLHASQNAEDLSQRVTTKQVGDDVSIDITVPYDDYNPEYAVQIQARDTESQQEFTTVLNYLLTPDEELVDTQGDKTKRVLREFNAAVKDGSMDWLETAFDRVLGANVDVSRDLASQSVQRLYELHQEAVETAAAGYDPKVLEKALTAARWSKVSYKVCRAAWFQEAEERLRKLRRIASMSKKVLELSPQTISEVHRINNPHPAVKSTLKALLIILGEHLKDLKEWKSVQSAMRATVKSSVLNRIRNFNPDSASDVTLEKSRDLLSTCSVDEIRAISAACATFYDWCCSMIQLKDPEHALEEAKTSSL